jgi:hypothetical protein
MAIQVHYKESPRLLYINTNHDNLGELQLIEKYYQKILGRLFWSSKIRLITLQPQKYSFAIGIGVSYEIQAGGQKVLVNEISNCDDNLLNEISQSEEFRRNLLILVKTDIPEFENRIPDILKMANEGDSSIDVPGVIVHCEDDGDSLFLYNSKLTVKELQDLTEGLFNPDNFNTSHSRQ